MAGVKAGEEYKVQFTLFDWKWLSNYKYFTIIITDPEELVGNKEVSIPIDFPALETSDKKGDSYYVVGGRAYFEADAIGP